MYVQQFENKNISINPELTKSLLLKLLEIAKFTTNTGKHEWHSKTT